MREAVLTVDAVEPVRVDKVARLGRKRAPGPRARGQGGERAAALAAAKGHHGLDARVVALDLRHGGDAAIDSVDGDFQVGPFIVKLVREVLALVLAISRIPWLETETGYVP